MSQEVGVFWRCKVPIEILVKKQWFMATKRMTEQVVETASELGWYPEYMKHRLMDWAKSLDWDWVISRQRVFATPIPVWYCRKCGESVVASYEELPVDPKMTQPRNARCPRCGGDSFVPERDVLDTWFDSSISCAHHAGWLDRSNWREFFPITMHPSGHDIIRTWAYYLLVRGLALFGETPYKSVLINGMTLGSDGRKMSKSLGNYVSTPEVFAKYGADPARQWAAAGGSTGSDIPFRWEDVEYGRRFIRKLWNACRFASLQLEEYTPGQYKEPMLLDRWLLSRLEKTTRNATAALESYQFNNALNEVRDFTWHTLCDHYIEDIKHRLYGEEEGRYAAQATVHTAVLQVLKLLAPFIPHVTEEIYQGMFASGDKDSIHTAKWPEAKEDRINEASEKEGDLIVAVIAGIRSGKSRAGLPLNAELAGLTICSDDEGALALLRQEAEEIAATVKASKIELLPGRTTGSHVEGYPEITYNFSTAA